MNTQPTAHRRQVLWNLLAVLLLTTALFGVPRSAAAQLPVAQGGSDSSTATGPAPVLAKVDPQVLEDLAGGNEASYWVVMKEKADLSKAGRIMDWNQRGRYVSDHLRDVAGRTQPRLIMALKKSRASYQSFWIVNAVKVKSASAVMNSIRALPEVKEIAADKTTAIPKPLPGKPEKKINGIEWNIAMIRADQVWSELGDRGEGIVVASIDTGVQFDHPALAGPYRGNTGAGFDHNYNWSDPTGICGSAPCDNVGHGTHTMGTMVGEDGEDQIGVAPRAKWIAVKGCEDNTCSTGALLAAGQWVLAPTDLTGNNPRPDLRPHVVNNSWGGGSDWYFKELVDAWVAAGIFPVFAAGNAGEYGCYSVGSPGEYPESYAVGAHDSSGTAAWFSSRGPSPLTGEIKPDISAPGVDVRSSVPGGYEVHSGTSMAAPHVVGAVALLWSAAPDLIGDIDTTRTFLDYLAVDAEDLSCGGDSQMDNVYGHGRLDIYAAIKAATGGGFGVLEGTVRAADTGAAIVGATVTVSGPASHSVDTDENGHYRFGFLAEGTYSVSFSAYGYRAAALEVAVVVDQQATADVTLERMPVYNVSGKVTDEGGGPVINASISVGDMPLRTRTGTDGSYQLSGVLEGEHLLIADAGGCSSRQETTVTVTQDMTLDFIMPRIYDAFGYYCQIVPPGYTEADTILPLAGDDYSISVSLPFDFPFYGNSYRTAYVSTNGMLDFQDLFAGYGSAIPDPNPPNALIAPFWTDLTVFDDSSVRTGMLGEDQFIIEWRNVAFYRDNAARLDFEVILDKNGQILTQYRGIDDYYLDLGEISVIGIEDETGSTGVQYSAFRALLAVPDFAIGYQARPYGLVTGKVIDTNDGLPISRAAIRALKEDSEVKKIYSQTDGTYRISLPLGDYVLEAGANRYDRASASVTLIQDRGTVIQDFSLRTAKGSVSPDALTLIVPAGKTRAGTLTLSNTGGLPLTWEIKEMGGGSAAAHSPARQVQAGAKAPPPLAAALPEGYDPNSTSSLGRKGLGVQITHAPDGPASTGDVLASWPTSAIDLAWGVGMAQDSGIWLSNSSGDLFNAEFTLAGDLTGQRWPAHFDSGEWPADMAYDSTHGLMCQVNVGGDNGIYCWDPQTGEVQATLTGYFAWNYYSSRGLAYRMDDDTFYTGGWNDTTLYKIKGLGSDAPGEVLWSCYLGLPISGLAYNPAANVVWVATNSEDDLIYAVDAENCTILSTLNRPFTGYAYDGAGLEMDANGNLWMLSQNAHMAYLVDSGVPSYQDVAWLSETPTQGMVEAGKSTTIEVMADAASLQPGIYTANLTFFTNSGRQSVLDMPVKIIVPAYMVGVNAGGSAYTDAAGNCWLADQAYATGSWGYINKSSRTASTRSNIAGTVDQPLYQTQRLSPTEYRFDNLPPGVYQVDLLFAEYDRRKANTRLFDVFIENQFALPDHDIVYEVGRLTADKHTFYFNVTDRQLNIRIVPWRGYAPPVINGILVVQRPDM